MKKKILGLVFIVLIFTGLYANANVASSNNCFRTLGWCIKIAEINFFNSSGTQADEQEFVDTVSDCVNEYGGCIDPPKE